MAAIAVVAIGCAGLAEADPWPGGAGAEGSVTSSSSTGGGGGSPPSSSGGSGGGGGSEGGAGGDPCPLLTPVNADVECAATYSESFGSDRMPSSWYEAGEGDAIFEYGPALQINLPDTSTRVAAYGVLVRAQQPMEGCSVSVHVIEAAFELPMSETWFAIANSENAIEWLIDPDGMVHPRIRNGATNTFEGETYPYDDGEPWWRFRVGSDQVAWDSSSNGKCWQERARTTTPLFVGSATVRLGAGHVAGAVSAATHGVFDDVRVQGL